MKVELSSVYSSVSYYIIYKHVVIMLACGLACEICLFFTAIALLIILGCSLFKVALHYDMSKTWFYIRNSDENIEGDGEKKIFKKQVIYFVSF